MYVKGGFFVELKECNGALKHLNYYGNKLGGECVEIPQWQKDSLKNDNQ